MLVTVVVGSGIAAATLSPDDVGLQLLENALATGAGLAVIILLVGPAWGAHLNPAVSLADWWLGRRAGGGLTLAQAGAYSASQAIGGSSGAVLANLMYDLPPVTWATTSAAARTCGSPRSWPPPAWSLSSSPSTAPPARAFRGSRRGVHRIGVLVRRIHLVRQPAVTVGRMFSDTFAGIAPGSVPPFVFARLVGGAVGVVAVLALYPDAAASADQVVVPTEGHDTTGARPSGT